MFNMLKVIIPVVAAGIPLLLSLFAKHTPSGNTPENDEKLRKEFKKEERKNRELLRKLENRQDGDKKLAEMQDLLTKNLADAHKCIKSLGTSL